MLLRRSSSFQSTITMSNLFKRWTVVYPLVRIALRKESNATVLDSLTLLSTNCYLYDFGESENNGDRPSK